VTTASAVLVAAEGEAAAVAGGLVGTIVGIAGTTLVAASGQESNWC